MPEVAGELESEEEGEEMRTFLVVRAVSPTHWGVYTCRADNNINNSEAAVLLKGDKNRVEASHWSRYCALIGGTLL